MIILILMTYKRVQLLLRAFKKDLTIYSVFNVPTFFTPNYYYTLFMYILSQATPKLY